jgi:D-alanyl-D-alanine carboxypeptidase
MPAGHSEHETGLAVDILSDTNSKMNETQADEAANKWLVENSWKYGFILRYPKDKTDITGIEYEPWHFRYVGCEAAEFLHEHDMVLEEFFEHL